MASLTSTSLLANRADPVAINESAQFPTAWLHQLTSACLTRSESTIKVHEVKLNNGTLRRREPLYLIPAEVNDGECFRLYVDGVGSTIVAYSIPDLREMVSDLLAGMWEEYALGDESKMTAGARQLREHLRENFCVVQAYSEEI